MPSATNAVLLTCWGTSPAGTRGSHRRAGPPGSGCEQYRWSQGCWVWCAVCPCSQNCLSRGPSPGSPPGPGDCGRSLLYAAGRVVDKTFSFNLPSTLYSCFTGWFLYSSQDNLMALSLIYKWRSVIRAFLFFIFNYYYFILPSQPEMIPPFEWSYFLTLNIFFNQFLK